MIMQERMEIIPIVCLAYSYLQFLLSLNHSKYYSYELGGKNTRNIIEI